MSEVKGKIIIIKRNGQDRVTYPLMSNSCLFGSGLECDIRVQLPSVSERHCILKVGPKDKVYLSSLSHGNITLLNNVPVSSTVPVNHKDILTVVDRCFRFEYPPKSSHYVDEDDSSVSAPEVKSLKVLSPRQKPPLFQVNGTPGKTPSSVKKKLMRKSLGSADINIYSDELSPLPLPRKMYSKKNSLSPRSMALSGKRKRVSFGPALSPEQFDKNMPPATPVRRGSLPRRHVTTPDYFGSPIITQYPRSKKKRLSMVPREQSIAEVLETPLPEALKQSPRNKYDAVSPKSLSPSGINKSSPKNKGSTVQMLQQEDSNKSPDITRKSPLARKLLKSASQSPVSKSSKSISPVQSLVASAGKGKANPRTTNIEVVSPSSSSLSDSPKQPVINAQKNSPFKSQNKAPKEKGSPSKLSPLKVWASVVSPSSKHASPLSRCKSPVNLTSVAMTPIHSLKTQVANKRVLSSGKRSSTHVVKRLSVGRSPSRPVSLSTPSRKSPLKVKKTNSASKVQSLLLSTPHSVLEDTPLMEKEKLCDEAHLSEDLYAASGGAVVSDLVENPNSPATTPRSSLKHRLDQERLSSGKTTPRLRVSKHLSVVKSPARLSSLSTPARRASGKFSEKNSSTGRSRRSFLLKPDFYAKEVSKNETSFSESHPGEVGEDGTDRSRSYFSHQVMDDSTKTPSSGRRSKLRATPTSSSKQQSSVKENSILTPEPRRKDSISQGPDDMKQVIPVGTSRMLRSPATPKSTKKRVSSPLLKTPSVSSPKTPGSKRKADSVLSPESSKKTRFSTSLSSKLSTPLNKVSPKSQSLLLEARYIVSPKELLSKSVSDTPIKNGRSTPSKLKIPSKQMAYKKKSISPNSKNKTLPSSSIKASPSLPKGNARTPPSRNLAKSEVKSPSVKDKLATSTRASPLAKSPSAKKVTPVTKKSSPKKVAPTSRSSKKQGTSDPSRQVQSPAKLTKKVFSVKKSSKKLLWTEVVRRGIMKKNVASKPKVVRSLLSNAVKKKKVLKSNKFLWMSVPTPNKKIASVMSTGHAESPETIIIRKRSSTVAKPARVRTSRAKDLLKSPGDSGVATETPNTSGNSSLLNSSMENRKNLSAAKRKSLLGSQKGTPDISPISTPNISKERFVSPLTTPRMSRKKNSLLEKFVLENQHVIKTVPVKSSRKSETPVGVKRLLKSRTPKTDYSNVAGVKRLMRTPRTSPKADYRDIRGIKRLVQTPKDSPKADYRDVRGVKKLVQTPKDSPKADYTDVRGIRRLVQTPKESPKADYRDVRGIRRLVQTPKDSPVADYRNVSGVKNLLITPASAKHGVSRAKTISIKQLYQNNTPPADYTKVKGIKQLFKVTQPMKGKAHARKTKTTEVVKEPDYSNVEGVKQLFREPEENEFNISGLQQLFSPVPTVSYGAKSDVVSPTVQEASPFIEKITTPKSRRKQSFGSSSSPANLADNKKSMLTASPIPQENAFAVDHIAEVTDVVVSPPKVKEGSCHRGTETPGSASKDSRSAKNASATLPQQQTPYLVRSSSRKKSVGTVVPLDSPLSGTNGKSPKVSRPEKSVTSPLQSVMTATSPSKTPPKTRQQTPALSAKDKQDTKNSQSPKQKRKSIEKGMKSDVEPNKNELSSALQNISPAATTQVVRKGKKIINANKIPEVITISDDDDDFHHDMNDVEVDQQKLKKGGRSTKTTSRHTLAANKGSRKGVGQEVSDTVQAQQVVSEVSPQKSRRAMRSQKLRTAEIPRENEAAPNDVAGGRAARSKASDVKKTGDSPDATRGVTLKSVSTRSKNGIAAKEMAEHSQEQTLDLHEVSGRTNRRKTVVSPESVGHSPVVGISSSKIGKRVKENKSLREQKNEDSHQLSVGEHSAVIEVKGSRTRGQVTKVVKKTSSQFVVPPTDKHEAGKVTRGGGSRQTRARQNLLPEVESSRLSAEDISYNDQVSHSHDLVDMKTLLHQEKVSTTPSRRTVSKQKQDSLTGDVGEMQTPTSAKSRKTQRNRKFPVSSEDNANTSSIAALEVAENPEMSRRSKRKIFSKSEYTTASLTAESIDDSTNMPILSKESRLRKNPKKSQESKTTSSLYESDNTSAGTRRSKRGHPQESENVPDILSKKSRTQLQKHVDSTDVVGQSVRGKTVKIDISDERTEVPHAKRPKRQVKKSSAEEEDNTSFQKDVNQKSVSKEKQTVGSRPSRDVAVTNGEEHNVAEVPSESDRPKRVTRATRGVGSVSSENDVKAVNSRPSRAKRGASDSVDDAVSRKRNRKEIVTEEGANVIEKTAKTTKVQPKSAKTRAPVLEAIPEVEEEIVVTPTVSKRASRAKASVKQNTKKSPVRRQTRSRKK